MNIELIRNFLLCGLVLLSTSVWSKEPLSGVDQVLFSSVADDYERVVLVLLSGRSGNQMMSGSRMMMYRGRGYSPDQTWNSLVAKEIAKAYGLQYVTDWWMSEIHVSCAVLKLPDNIDMDQTLKTLRADKNVLSAEQMQVFSTLGDSVVADPYLELQQSVTYFDLTSLHRTSTGKDIRIAVIDTGVEIEHPDLAGQIMATENFVDPVSPSFTEDMHGTAVAGVMVARSGNGLGIVGVAPDAKVIALKACWPETQGSMAAFCNSFTLALALNKAIAMEADVINLSLSGPEDKIIEQLVREAVQRGITVVAANKTEDLETISFPASVPGVIAVTDNTLPARVAERELVAVPSQKIITTIPVGKYNYVSGTSLGAAQVSGYVALLKQMKPHLTQDDIRAQLRIMQSVASN